MKSVSLGHGFAQPLRVNDLDVEDLPDVDRLHHPPHALLERRIRIEVLAVGRTRIRVLSARDVECVETQAEVVAIHGAHHSPRLLPRIVERAPAQILVREAERRALSRAQVGNLPQVARHDVEVAREALGLERTRDLDDVRAEDVRNLEPEAQLFQLGRFGGGGQEALAVAEGADADDFEAKGGALGLDFVGGADLVGGCGAARVGGGEVEQVFEEDL